MGRELFLLVYTQGYLAVPEKRISIGWFHAFFVFNQTQSKIQQSRKRFYSLFLLSLLAIGAWAYDFSEVETTYDVRLYYTIKNVLQNYNIEATFEANPVVLTIKTGDGGKVGVNVKRGETYSCVINPESGWHVNTVLFNDNDVTSQVTNGIYNTPNLNNDALLIVTFEQNTGATQVRQLTSNSAMKAYATSDGLLKITGTEVGEIIKVVSADGKLLTTIVSDGQAMYYQLPTHGVYIVHSAQKSVKLNY